MEKRNAILIIISILLSISFLSCGEKEDRKITDLETDIEVQDDFEITEGSASIMVKAPDEIKKVEITVSSPDIKVPIAYDLVKEEGIWTGILGNLPLGNDKTAVVNAYNENDDLLYNGNAVFSIIGNNNITIIIQLNDIDTSTKIAPFIQSVALTPQKVAPGEEVNLDVSAVDQDSDAEISYQWTADGGLFDNDKSATPLWTAPSESGIYELTVTAKDPDENVDLVTIQVEVDNFYQENTKKSSQSGNGNH